MTIPEFSDGFDTLFSPNLNGNITIDEYLKSIFLTKALLQITNEALVLPTSATLAQVGFGSSAKRTIDLSSLTRILQVTPTNVSTSSDLTEINPYPTLNVWKVDLKPNDPRIQENQILSFVSENLVVSYNSINYPLLIVLLTDEEIKRAMSRPYCAPLKRLAWRVLATKNNSDRDVSYDDIDSNTSDAFYQKLYLILHPEEVGEQYTLVYIKRPLPIILTDLSDLDVSIEGYKEVHGCELDPTVHQEVLERAVTLAKAAALNTTMTEQARKQKERKGNKEEED